MAETEPAKGKGRCGMRAIAKAWRWWRALWELDFSSPMGVDAHLWANKIEMRRRSVET
jgi:hypothetical protein